MINEYIKNLLKDKHNSQFYIYGIVEFNLNRYYQYFTIKTKWFKLNDLNEYNEIKEKVKNYAIENTLKCIKDLTNRITIDYYLAIINLNSNKEHRFKLEREFEYFDGGIR